MESPQIFYLGKKLEKPFKFTKNWSLKEIEFGSLIIYRKRWKLNPTAPLIHPFYNGYLRVYYAN